MKALRKKLNLTQQEFAELMGLSRSVVSMHEQGKRNLPAKATHQLVAIQRLLLQQPVQNMQLGERLARHQQLQQAKLQKQLKAHAERATVHALRISQTLARIEKRYDRLSQKLAVIRLLMQEAEPATRHMSLLENMEQNVLDAMVHCCPAKQELLRYRLQLFNSWQQAALQARSRMQNHTG